MGDSVRLLISPETKDRLELSLDIRHDLDSVCSRDSKCEVDGVVVWLVVKLGG